nr:DUF3267 domain-containing protein [Anaerotalea alkaliphila]
MRRKMPKFNQELHAELLETGWVLLKEPRHLAGSILMSVPLMFFAVLLSLGAVNGFSSVSFEEFGFTTDAFSIRVDLGVVFLLLLFTVLHESIHLVFIPGFLRSDRTYVGITWFGGFVVTEEVISRRRYLVVSAAPFVLLSILLPLLLGAFGVLMPAVKFLVLLNAMASSVDLLNLLLAVLQVPKEGALRNNGPKTYWKNTTKERKTNGLF